MTIHHVVALHRTTDAADRLRMIAEAQDEIVRPDGVVMRGPTYWVLDAKPVEMIDHLTFVIRETGERLILDRLPETTKAPDP